MPGNRGASSARGMVKARATDAEIRTANASWEGTWSSGMNNHLIRIFAYSDIILCYRTGLVNGNRKRCQRFSGAPVSVTLVQAPGCKAPGAQGSGCVEREA